MSARSAAHLYEDDLYAWTQLQAKELRRFARTRPNLPLDLPNIAEEIADLGRSQRDSCAAGHRTSSSIFSSSSIRPQRIRTAAGSPRS